MNNSDKTFSPINLRLRREWHELDMKVDAIDSTIEILTEDRARFRAEADKAWARVEEAEDD